VTCWLALSTSGTFRPNILAALRTARQRGLGTIGFTGSKGGKHSGLCATICLVAPSDDHAGGSSKFNLTVAHGICDQIEQTLLREASRKMSGVEVRLLCASGPRHFSIATASSNHDDGYNGHTGADFAGCRMRRRRSGG